MIRILAIYPAFDVEINEMAMVWRTLCATASVQCSVLAGRYDRLKGQEAKEEHENHLNLEIHRFPLPIQLTDEVLSIARQAKPDLIFCAVLGSMPIALAIQKTVQKPIVLHNEYFLDSSMLLRRRNYLGIGLLRPMVCAVYRRLLFRSVARVLCSNPYEFRILGKKPPDALGYLPWPHVPQGRIVPFGQRENNLSTFVGSMSREKGATVLLRYFSRLLNAMPEFRLTLIGPPMDRAGKKTCDALQNGWRGRVVVRANCSRGEALDAIRRSLFVLSPGKRLGWGLIGDAWASGTPVLAFAEHYDLEDRKNCLITRDEEEFVDAVAVLRKDQQLWSQLSAGGLRTVATGHRIELIAKQLYRQLLCAQKREPVLLLPDFERNSFIVN